MVAGRSKHYRTAAEHYFQQPELARLLAQTQSSISTGADLTDYFILHRYIMVRRPRRILELGSGVTTIIMADALMRIASQNSGEPSGHLETMESIPKYYENARSLCLPHLRTFVSYNFSPQKETQWRGELWTVGYENLPRGEFDFVFVDGPDLMTPRGNAVDGDLLALAERTPAMSFNVMIDGRLGTRDAYARYFKSGKICFDPAANLGAAVALTGQDLRKTPAWWATLRECNIFRLFGLADERDGICE